MPRFIQRVIGLKEDCKIHIKNKNGIYTVVAIETTGVHVSCHAWIARANHPNVIPTKFYKYNEIKCLAGGFHNYHNPYTIRLRVGYYEDFKVN